MADQTNIWGWDLANWVKVITDVAGHLQVDTLSSALPTGAATGGRQDVQTDLISLIRILLAARLPAILSVNVATTGKISVGAVSTAVLAANANRIFAQFVNDSDEEIYLDLSDTAVMNEGIRLNANGGSFEIGSTNLYTGAVTAISGVAAQNLTVSEG